MSIKPITPQEAKEQIEKSFPEFVIQGVNNAINKNYFGKRYFTIKQDAIVAEIMAVAPEGTDRESLFSNHWLDFEELYQKFGWDVKYDKPGYNESYDAYFKFTVKS